MDPKSQRTIVCHALLVFFLAGCSSGGDAGWGVVARDSAGIRITENGATRLPVWTLESSPRVDLGGDETAALHEVTSVSRMRDGRILVATGGSPQVRIFGPDGRLVRSVGRAGDGPGEFRYAAWVGVLRGDSIATWDGGLGRLSIFTGAGEFAAVVTPAGGVGFAPQAVGSLSDGRILLSVGGSGRVPGPGRSLRDTLTFVLLGRAGELRDTIGRFPGPEMIAVGNPATGFLLAPLPFGRQTFVAVHGMRVYVASGDRFEIAGYEPQRGLRQLIRAERELLRVTKEDVRAYRKSVVTVGAEGNAQVANQTREMLDQAPYPRTQPWLTSLKVDPDGFLWVEEPGRPGDERGRRWTVFDQLGREVASVWVPSGLVVHEVGPDWVLGVSLDEDHAEHVRLYRLLRAPGT